MNQELEKIVGIVQAKDLTFEYIRRDEEGNVEGITTAVDNVNIDIKAGDFVAVLGHNGSGKSTIARYLYNLSLPLNEQSPNYNFCTQEGYSKEAYSIVVFDEYFKQKNFFEQDSLKGIFSLNQANEWKIRTNLALLFQ